MADGSGSSSKDIGIENLSDNDVVQSEIEEAHANVAENLALSGVRKNEAESSYVSEQRIQTYANKEKVYLRFANLENAHSLPNVKTEEKAGKTVDEVYREMQNMASLVKEVHNVVSNPPPTTTPPVLQVNARVEQPFKWQDLLSQLMIIGAGFLALFFAGKKIDQVRLAAEKKFDEAMLEVRDARKSWEADGRPSLITNRLALWNKGETSSRASKKDGPESSKAGVAESSSRASKKGGVAESSRAKSPSESSSQKKKGVV